jgi:hypothetical protein
VRYVGFLVLILAALWAGDRYFYNGRYFNEILFDLNQEAQKLNYEVRRWVRF